MQTALLVPFDEAVKAKTTSHRFRIMSNDFNNKRSSPPVIWTAFGTQRRSVVATLTCLQTQYAVSSGVLVTKAFFPANSHVIQISEIGPMSLS